MRWTVAAFLSVTALGLSLNANAAQPERGLGHQEAAKNYLQYCAGCHHADGHGSVANDVPDMRGVIGKFTHVDSGRAFLVQVAGVAQAPLADPDLAKLLNWLLATFSRAEIALDFVPFSASEVHTLRAARPADVPALRARVVQQLRDLGQQIADYSPTTHKQ